MANKAEQYKYKDECDLLEGYGSHNIYNGKKKRKNQNETEEKEIYKQELKVEKKEEKQSKREFVTYKYSEIGKGELHEAIISNGLPFFLKYNHDSKKFELIAEIEENNRILKPPEREEYPYTPYEFSSLEEINR